LFFFVFIFCFEIKVLFLTGSHLFFRTWVWLR